MSRINDEFFLNRISSRLDGFKRVDQNTWNCRCPLCGDSQKNKKKARGFFFPGMTDKDMLCYKCHNCGQSMSFSRFLKQIDPVLYKNYLFDRMAETGNKRRHILDPVPFVDEAKPITRDDFFESKVLDWVKNLSEDHICTQFLTKRQIPRAAWDQLAFAKEFKTFVNVVKPGKFSMISNDYPALVIPLVGYNNTVFGFQGRCLDGSGPRYMTIMLKDGEGRLFGADKVDWSRKFYVTEGPLDSMFLDNAIAVCGSDMQSIKNPNAIFVLDCEPRNQQIVQKYKKLIESGARVCMLPPKVFSGMDINDMILDGYDAQEIMDMIDIHSYTGLVATIQFQEWRRT